MITAEGSLIFKRPQGDLLFEKVSVDLPCSGMDDSKQIQKAAESKLAEILGIPEGLITFDLHSWDWD